MADRDQVTRTDLDIGEQGVTSSDRRREAGGGAWIEARCQEESFRGIASGEKESRLGSSCDGALTVSGSTRRIRNDATRRMVAPSYAASLQSLPCTSTLSWVRDASYPNTEGKDGRELLPLRRARTSD